MVTALRKRGVVMVTTTVVIILMKTIVLTNQHMHHVTMISSSVVMVLVYHNAGNAMVNQTVKINQTKKVVQPRSRVPFRNLRVPRASVFLEISNVMVLPTVQMVLMKLVVVSLCSVLFHSHYIWAF